MTRSFSSSVLSTSKRKTVPLTSLLRLSSSSLVVAQKDVHPAVGVPDQHALGGCQKEPRVDHTWDGADGGLERACGAAIGQRHRDRAIEDEVAVRRDDRRGALPVEAL